MAPKTKTSDIETPLYTYQWGDADQTFLIRFAADGRLAGIPADPTNSDYAEFLSSGATAAAYVPPEPPPEKTTEEKVNQLLSDYGLTREEMQAALDVKTSKTKK